MKILVCGGAGYIGSHLVRELLKTTSHEIIVFDNLSKGHLSAVSQSSRVHFEQGNVGSKQDLERIFSTWKPEAVFHFCAWIEVGESCGTCSAFHRYP